jgi:hypothetical protein
MSITKLNEDADWSKERSGIQLIILTVPSTQLSSINRDFILPHYMFRPYFWFLLKHGFHGRGYYLIICLSCDHIVKYTSICVRVFIYYLFNCNWVVARWQ